MKKLGYEHNTGNLKHEKKNQSITKKWATETWKWNEAQRMTFIQRMYEKFMNREIDG